MRQDSALWGDLHDGMLTTGRLKQALGMHEPKAAGVIGIHPGSVSCWHNAEAAAAAADARRQAADIIVLLACARAAWLQPPALRILPPAGHQRWR